MMSVRWGRHFQVVLSLEIVPFTEKPLLAMVAVREEGC